MEDGELRRFSGQFQRQAVFQRRDFLLLRPKSGTDFRQAHPEFHGVQHVLLESFKVPGLRLAAFPHFLGAKALVRLLLQRRERDAVLRRQRFLERPNFRLVFQVQIVQVTAPLPLKIFQMAFQVGDVSSDNRMTSALSILSCVLKISLKYAALISPRAAS